MKYIHHKMDLKNTTVKDRIEMLGIVGKKLKSIIFSSLVFFYIFAQMIPEKKNIQSISIVLGTR